MNSTDHMKVAAVQELKDAIQIKKVNDELLEFLGASQVDSSRLCKT